MERGLYEAAFSVDITATDGGTILYSLDGQPPASALSGPLDITTTTTVSALELAADGTTSGVVTHTYLFPADVMVSSVMDPAVIADETYGPLVADTLWALPTISLVTTSVLSTTEQEVSVEWIDPDGETLQVRCGARDVGGHSLGYEKNNIRLSFRGEYGTPKLELDLFADVDTGVSPADEHDALTLRSGSHDSVFYLGAAGQYARNRWMDETQLEMGHLAPHGRPGHLYINGEYTGLYHIRERFDASFLAAYLGGDEDDYEAVNGGRAVDGDGSAWAAAVASASDYDAFRSHVDIDNYIDYMILNFYAGNDWDWNPEQNWMAAGPALAGDGAGRFVFHSSDSDICLYYNWDINILHESGPSYTFDALESESHPDFWMRFADRAHALLADDGVLSVDRNIARYADVTNQVEAAVVAESARWGQGWWDRDAHWAVERRRLMEDFFPYRTDELLRQFRAAGWYHLDAPDVTDPTGLYMAGDVITASVPPEHTAQLLLTVDGTDPRRPGGDIAAGVAVYDQQATVVLDHSTRLQARLYSNGLWGPLRDVLYELDEPSPIILNEWNAVSEDGWLKNDGEDTVLGRVQGNGGDWIELLVVEDSLDLRGWTLQMTDRAGPAGTLTFTDEPLLSNLSAGTLITIAAALPEDAAYDPENGDWRFHLQASPSASGRYISAAAFSVSHREWQVTILDANGRVRSGATGEGVSPLEGISSKEVGLLAATPTEDLRRTDADYTDGSTSSFGAPNVWSGGGQDLSALRGVAAVVIDVGDTAAPQDTDGKEQPSGPTTAATGCDSQSGGTPGGWLAVGLMGVLLRRRRMVFVGLPACQPVVGDSAGTVGEPGADTAAVVDRDGDGFWSRDDCDDRNPHVHPDAAEVCDGVDNDCDALIDDEDGDLVDGLPFYLDEDGDGYGAEMVTACTAEGHALVDGDCDDQDDQVHPDAEEYCDGVDRNCDGIHATAPGTSAACAAESCAAIVAAGAADGDGAYWLELASGGSAPVWCDMSTDGGGWTLGFLRNSVSMASQGDFGAGDVSPSLLAVSPESASSDTTARMAWIDLNALPWDTMRVASYRDGMQTWVSADIPVTDLRISFGEDGYRLYGEGGYYWCGGDQAYTDSGVGAVNNPVGATADCRGHASLGSGWDFSDSLAVNAGLTLCGGDGSSFLSASWRGDWTFYGTAGGAQALWVR